MGVAPRNRIVFFTSGIGVRAAASSTHVFLALGRPAPASSPRGWRIAPAESCFHQALDEARRAGDVILEIRCLTYLTVARRFERDVPGTSELASESLQRAEAAGALEYVGAAESNLA